MYDSFQLNNHNVIIHEAMHDSLTGVYNRKAILNLLSKEFSRAIRTGGLLSVGMCDLDHFKIINDKYGHQTGDDVLKGFTSIMVSSLRDYDLIGRYGGEEFLIILPSYDDNQKMTGFNRLCKMISDSKIETRSGDISITVSIGATLAEGKSSIDEILTDADNTLYRAKDMGRNCVCLAE